MTAPSAQNRLTRGLLVQTDATGTSKAITFQFNPESVQRTLEPNTVGGRPGARSEIVRYAGAPSETLTLECRLSAADGADGNAGTVPAPGGIEPQLAALALLAYPSTTDVQAAQALLDAGTVEVLPAPADPLLFVWGSRVMPVRVVTCSIVEELYDASLSPVLATVSLSLRTLSYSDVDATTTTAHQFMAYQQGLETTAAAAYTPWSGTSGSGT
jgi:hypothetical protein